MKAFQENSCEKSKIIKRITIEEKRNKVFNLFPEKLKTVLHKSFYNLLNFIQDLKKLVIPKVPRFNFHCTECLSRQN